MSAEDGSERSVRSLHVWSPAHGASSPGRGLASRLRQVARDPGGLADLESLSFTDDSGTRWQVNERDCRDDTGARGDCCLVFASWQAVRRVWQYPQHWRELGPDALFALSWGR
jgi:hypothetical protein